MTSSPTHIVTPESILDNKQSQIKYFFSEKKYFSKSEDEEKKVNPWGRVRPGDIAIAPKKDLSLTAMIP